MANNESNALLDDELVEYRLVRDLVEKTHLENPSSEDRAALRCALEASPNLWRWAGDVARLASEKVIATYAPGSSALCVESMNRGLAVMREELGYEAAGPLERMLIEQLLTCWLHVNLLETLHCDKLSEWHTAEGGVYWDRRLSAAQRRFNRACESLARVRRLVEGTKSPKQQVGEGLPAETKLLSVLTGTH